MNQWIYIALFFVVGLIIPVGAIAAAGIAVGLVMFALTPSIKQLMGDVN